MAYVDAGREEADALLQKLEKRITAHYGRALRSVSKKLDTYLKKFAEKDKQKAALVAAGKMSEREYAHWRLGQVMISKRWREMQDVLATDLTNADKIAMDMLRGDIPSAYAIGHNYGTYEAEKGSMLNTSYTLYDKDTVARLVKEDPDLLPKPTVNIPEDELWNKQHIKNAITQGILQGEDINKISGRLKRVTDMDKNAAIRNARTMFTSAENAGRVNSYKRAEEKGIKMKQVWVATLDGRTRFAHAELDGQERPVGEPFENAYGEIMYPGDPGANPANIYNCRCTLIAKVDGVDLDVADMSLRDNRLGDMTYNEWKEQAALERKVKEAKESLQEFFPSVRNSFMSNDKQLIVDNADQFLKLNKKYGAVTKNNAGYLTAQKKGNAVAWTSTAYHRSAEQTTLSLVDTYYKNPEYLRQVVEKNKADFKYMPSSESSWNIYAITHEYGHMLQYMISKKRENWDFVEAAVRQVNTNQSTQKMKKAITSIYNEAEMKQAEKMYNEIIGIAKRNNPHFDISRNLSEVGQGNFYEGFAEMFANSECGEPNELGLAMREWLRMEGFR